MQRRFAEFTGQFFWNFKRMDNVNYNFEIIETLFLAKKTSNDPHFNKPIIILLVAIIECCLYDFLVRINQHRYDAVPNLAQPIITYIRSMGETDELKRLIPRVRSQNLLRVNPEDTLYDDLEFLRKVRNRVHIQNRYSVLSRNESAVFTNVTLELAQDCLEKVVGTLCNTYPRWGSQPISMTDFPRPWL